MARAFFAALAVLDSLLFLYLLVNYGWFNFEFPDLSGSIAGIVLVPLMWGITLLDRFIAIAFFAAAGTGIWKDLSGRDRPRWGAIVTTPALVFAIAATAFVWIVAVRAVLLQPPGMVHDRLTVFDAFARQARIGDLETLGLVNYAAGSIGAFLITLLGVLYLAEKYLLQSWRVRWPIPVTPLVALGWIGWIIAGGEARLREYVAARQWRPIGPELSWIDAVSRCESLGEGWRLPQRPELTRFLASQPADIRGWQGVAWTNSSAGGGDWAVGVDLAPRRSGRWNKASEPTRDESLCEYREQPGYASDWFTSYRTAVCERTPPSPYLFTPGLHPVALQRGATVFQPPGAAICVRAPDAARIPIVQGRGYHDEAAFTRAADFHQVMTERCRQSPDGNRAACFAFAPDLPPFAESDDERTMRAFCEVVRNGEACHRYAVLMDQHPDAADRAARYRALACRRGYASACSPRM